jgi:hypothetical protein
MSLWLTREELEEMTGFKTPRKWRFVLAAMNVKFRTRPDGFPLVERAQFTNPPENKRRNEPKWD